MVVRPGNPKRRRRFRWEIILIPALVLLFVYVANNVVVGFSFDDLMHQFGIEQPDRFRNLAVLGVLITAVVFIARVIRSNDKPKD